MGSWCKVPLLCLGLESEDFQRKEDNLRVIEKNIFFFNFVDFTKDKDAAIDGGKVEQAQGHSVQNLGLGGFEISTKTLGLTLMMEQLEKNICTSLCVKYTEEELSSCKKHIFPQIRFQH